MIKTIKLESKGGMFNIECSEGMEMTDVMGMLVTGLEMKKQEIWEAAEAEEEVRDDTTGD